MFGHTQPVVRVRHPGSDFRAAVAALGRLLGYRLLGYADREAALRVRSSLHRPEVRALRLRQLSDAVQQTVRRTGAEAIDLAGHSFGTDTVLQYALSPMVPIRNLWLFSPHPPGYLIPSRDYARLSAQTVHVVVGSRDTTRDGVGPRDRMWVEHAVGSRARLLVPEGFRHMDFAGSKVYDQNW